MRKLTAIALTIFSIVASGASGASGAKTVYYTCGSYITCNPSVDNKPSVCKMYDGASYLFIQDSDKYYTEQTTLFLGLVKDHTLIVNHAQVGIADCFYYKDAYKPDDASSFEFVSDLNHHSVFPLFDQYSVWTFNKQNNEYSCNPTQSQCHLDVIY